MWSFERNIENKNTEQKMHMKIWSLQLDIMVNENVKKSKRATSRNCWIKWRQSKSWINWIAGLLVSVPTCQEPRMCHSHTYNKKSPDKLKKQTYLDPSEIWDHRTRRDRWLYPDRWATICLHETEATRDINWFKHIKGKFDEARG